MPVPMGVGIGVYFSLSGEPPTFLGLSLLALIIILILPFYRNKALFYGWIILFLLLLGFTAAQLRTFSVAAPVLQKKSYPVTLEGRVDSIEFLSTSYRITLEDFQITTGKIFQEPLPKKVRVKLKNNDPAQPVAGDIIRIKAVLVPPSPPVLPGAYDFERGSYFKGLGATGYALSGLEILEHHQGGGFFEFLRQKIRDRVKEKEYFDRDMKGLTLAFLIGDSHAISEQDWEAAQKSGIAHLIAISGSHFVLISGIIFFMTRALLAMNTHVALRYPVKKISALVALAGSIFYLFLIGAPIPAQRAAIMTSLIMLAIVLDREPLTLRLAAFAAIAIMLFKPESILGASFHLSFAAVVGLIAFFEARRDWWHNLTQEAGLLRKIGLFMFASVLTTVVATICTAPFAFYHFLSMPIMSGIIANMIAVPFSSFVTIPFGILACLLMPFHLEDAPLWIMQKSLEYIMIVARDVASWPDMVYHIHAWPSEYLIPIALGGLWICVWKGSLRWVGLLPIFIAWSFIMQTPRPDILLSGDGARLMAVRDADGKLWLSSKRAGKFVREAWIEREGANGTGFWPEEGYAIPGNDFLLCDNHACTYRMKGKTVSFLKEGIPPEEECYYGDILVMPFDEKPQDCMKDGRVIIIDKWDLYYNAAYAIYFSSEVSTAPVIKTVSEDRGIRPWTGRQKKEQRRFDDLIVNDDQ